MADTAAPPALFRCSTCAATYSRQDHLRRHEMMHQGRRLCVCEFCNARFHRRDILRRHYLACKSRGDRPVPEQQRPGRRKSACDRCASFKLACDLRRPCQACESAGSPCTWRRVQQRTAVPEPDVPTSSPSAPEDLEPAPEDLEPAAQHSRLHTSSPSAPEDLEPAPDDLQPAVPPPRAPRLALDTADICMSFVAALCGPGRKTVPEVFGFLSVPPEPLPRPPARDLWSRSSGSDPASSLSGGEVASGPDSGVDIGLPDHCSLLGGSPSAGGAQQPRVQDQTKDRLRELVMRLTDAYISLPRDHAARASVRVEDAYSFFTPPNLRTFMHTYFHHFHPHCPITHRPSFDARTASLPLVLVVCLAGALYSSCPDDATVARSLLGLAEECVFGDPCFRQLANRPAGARSAQGSGAVYLQAVQAAVILVCVQNIEGDAATRRRIRTTRLDALAASTRALGLTSARNPSHADLAPPSAHLFDWHQFALRETQTRLVHYVFLIDATVCIMHNVPPRLALAEVAADMPCSEQAFAAVRRADCVAVLCANQAPETPSLRELLRALLRHDWCEEALRGMTELHFLIAINALLVMIWTARASMLGCSTTADNIDRALTRWKVAWDARRRVPASQQFKRLGFMKHALDYWWLARLLLHVSRVDGENDFRDPPFHDDDMSYVRSLIAHFAPRSLATL
ncbi:putative zinc c2h2 type domain containing protein [Neofusicoccum parvum UCRNP2]|uniref:Putative zinc c2h2 type domain containing protein n=1 Tax=Botryosphaeria parva (strain UCR-NP2) TaxID=1287680 RepID=R1E828_BOTPV|nr:putative zinc c2h2 type domain containing protein [Neofusicoccum parvum UCRNP2]